MTVHINEVERIQNEQLHTELDKLKTKYRTLMESNKLLEQERDRNHQTLSDMSKLNKQLCDELQAIKSRGFWKRLFNRE
jgi:regulator of replication initiation timing